MLTRRGVHRNTLIRNVYLRSASDPSKRMSIAQTPLSFQCCNQKANRGYIYPMWEGLRRRYTRSLHFSFFCCLFCCFCFCFCCWCFCCFVFIVSCFRHLYKPFPRPYRHSGWPGRRKRRAGRQHWLFLSCARSQSTSLRVERPLTKSLKRPIYICIYIDFEERSPLPQSL